MSTLIAYQCPSCGTMLEAERASWQDWFRCPICEKPGQPPYTRATPTTPPAYSQDILYIGEAPQNAGVIDATIVESPATPPYTPSYAPPPNYGPQPSYGSPPAGNGSTPSTPTNLFPPGYPGTHQFQQPMPEAPAGPGFQRVVLGGAFFLSVVLTLISLVQRNAAQAGVLAVVSVFLVILLARSNRY